MPDTTKSTKPALRHLNIDQQPRQQQPLQPYTPTTAPAARPMRSLAGRTVGDLGKVQGLPERDYLLLDRSGSMDAQWKEALDGINRYARTLGSRVNTRIMLATFDDPPLYEVIRRDLHPLQWRPVTDEEVAPRGGTALNDAIRSTVAQAEADNPEKATIVIMTDGGENASTQTTNEQANALLDRCRKRGWQVIFLGMGFNNSAQAQGYGAAAAQAIAAGKQSITATLEDLAQKRTAYSQSGQAIGFTEIDKQDAAKFLPKSKS
jgi:hypothetical protein